MIIDDTHRMAFVHIPKCGGTSVSLQLGAIDAYAGAFRKKGVHPVLGAVHYAHIPLRYLRECYPDQFAKLKAYRSFALTREPHARFASAIFQRLEEFCGIPKIEVTEAHAVNEALAVIAWLSQRKTFCDLDHIHFTRQTDYVALDGERVVQNVFALENIAAMSAALEASCGVHFDPERRENTNFASGNGLLGVLHAAKPIYSRLTTWAFRERLLLLMQRMNLQKPDGLYDALRRDARVSKFVDDYYADDLALYRASSPDGGGR
jgi:hypothetical protein